MATFARVRNLSPLVSTRLPSIRLVLAESNSSSRFLIRQHASFSTRASRETEKKVIAGRLTTLSNSWRAEGAVPVLRYRARLFCDKAAGGKAPPSGSAGDHGSKAFASGVRESAHEVPENAIVLTPYQKVAGAAKGGMWLGIAGLALVCGYFIVKELLPTRLNPNTLFSEACDIILADPDVQARVGHPMKGYGRDHHGTREGRRNFVESHGYKDKDGKKRMRIRFNVKGPLGRALIYAETREGMHKGEYVYLIAQVWNTGEVITIKDNRAMLDATPQEQSAMEALIKGGK